MAMHVDNWTFIKKYGIESGDPEIGTTIGVSIFNNGKFAVQSGTPQEGSVIGVNGGMNPTTILPSRELCGLDFWTSKQAFYHTYLWEPQYEDWKDRIIDSAIYLLNIGVDNTVKQSIDLEPVIAKIIINISSERTDTYERNPSAPVWVNPYFYDRYKNYEALVTPSSPDYMDIPLSTTTRTVKYVSGSRDNASSYIRPASYCGPLGPVYAGIKTEAEVTTLLPWKNMAGPSDPANIAVRDIKLDATGNLWCLLQIGWHWADIFSNEVRNSSYMGYECRIGMGYDDAYPYGSSANPTAYPGYDPGYFFRQYVPPHSGTYAEQVDRMYRCGLPRARMFLVCFNKSTNFKTWDYLPFIPGTVGYRGKYYVEANIRGPCYSTIINPPLKLDVDEFGNVYAVCGTWFGLDRINFYPSTHWEGLGFAFNEYMRFYQRLDSEMPSGYTKPTTGIDVGRIGPHTPGGYGTCTLWKYDLDCTAYKGKTSGSNKTCYKSAWCYTIGGDRAIVTASWDSPSTKIKKYWFSALGNRTLSKCSIKIDYSVKNPRPVLDTSGTSLTQMPWNIRSWRSEWYYTSGSDSGRELIMEMDLLFAQCDLFTRNYYGATENSQPSLANMESFDPQSWWEYEEPWRNGSSNYPSQIHPDRTGFFQIGNAYGENPTGFNPAESMRAYYPHAFSVGAAKYETSFLGFSGVGTVYYQRIPLQKGVDGSDMGWDAMIKPASTPYVNPQTGDYYERCSISGSLPTMVSRHPNESTIITPFYNFKYELFTFSGVTWDSFESLRGRYPQTKTAPWPYRWHSMKHWITQASEQGLSSSHYGPKSSYIDPTVPLPGDYVPVKGERVVRYTAGFVDAVATVTAAANSGDAAAQQALTQFNQYLAQVKFTIYDTLMQDMNFGTFGSSVKCSDKVGMLTPMPLLHAYYIHEQGNWDLNLVWDPHYGKRLYIINPETKNFDCTWKLTKTPLKQYWEKIVNWATQYVHVNPPVSGVTWYDLSNDHIQTLKKNWVLNPDYAEYIAEHWQQLEFVNRYPDGTRISPQFHFG